MKEDLEKISDRLKYWYYTKNPEIPNYKYWESLEDIRSMLLLEHTLLRDIYAYAKNSKWWDDYAHDGEGARS